jgi:hypothetical protein
MNERKFKTGALSPADQLYNRDLFNQIHNAVPLTEAQRLHTTVGIEHAKLQVIENKRMAVDAGLKVLEGCANRMHQSESARLSYERCYASVKKSCEEYAKLSGKTLHMPGYVRDTRPALEVIQPTADWLDDKPEAPKQKLDTTQIKGYSL